MKKKIYVFHKQFEKFEDGWNDILKANCIYDFLGPIAESCCGEASAKSNLLTILNDNIPDIEDPMWPNVYGLNIGPYSTSLRTPHGVSFGWTYDRDAIKKGKVIYNFEVKFVSPTNRMLSDRVNKAMQALEKKGWTREVVSHKYRNDQAQKSDNGQKISTQKVDFENDKNVLKSAEFTPVEGSLTDEQKADLKDVVTPPMLAEEAKKSNS